MATKTFIIDCPQCKAKVAAEEKGRAERSGFNDDVGEPWAHRVFVGACPHCGTLLAGESYQTAFEGFNADEDRWGNVVRVFPSPPKEFSSTRIPNIVKDSLIQGDRAMQASANTAACVMFGRALEALCRDVLEVDRARLDEKEEKQGRRKIMLGEGIRQLREKRIIDDRLFEWSQQLQAFRNLAAHPEDIVIAWTDAEDLQTFVYAIVEYVYDLTDRYNEFKRRLGSRQRREKMQDGRPSK